MEVIIDQSGENQKTVLATVETAGDALDVTAAAVAIVAATIGGG